MSVQKELPLQRMPDIGIRDIWYEVEALPKLGSKGQLLERLRQTAETLIAAPLSTVLTLISVTLALFILAAFSYLMTNINQAVGGIEDHLRVSVYLKDDVSTERAKALIDLVRSKTISATISYRSKEKALDIFRESLGEDKLVAEGLEKVNPLPASIEIVLPKGETAHDLALSLRDDLGTLPQVERVIFGESAMQNMDALLSAVRWVGIAGLILVLVVCAFIVATSIRLGLHSHREEIEIMRLVGAPHRSIEFPYLIEGIMQGLLGAIFSLLLLFGFHRVLMASQATSDFFKLLIPELSFLQIWSVVLILMVGVFVGAVGSYVAVRRYLREKD